MKKQEITILETIQDLVDFFGSTRINSALLFACDNPFPRTDTKSQFKNYKIAELLLFDLAEQYNKEAIEHYTSVSRKKLLIRDAAKAIAKNRLASLVDCFTAFQIGLAESTFEVTDDTGKFDFNSNTWSIDTCPPSKWIRFLA